MTTRKPSPATLAARALRAIPSAVRTAQSRANGSRGGRPTGYVLIDSLGRLLGTTTSASGRAGQDVEYGWRGADGILRVEGEATLKLRSSLCQWLSTVNVPDKRYDVSR